MNGDFGPATIVDIAVLAGIVVLSLFISRYRRAMLSGAVETVASALIVTGMALLGVVHLDTLFNWQLLSPSATGAAAVVATESSSAADLVTLLSLTLICIGLVLGVRAWAQSLAQLQMSEERYRSIVQDQSELIVRWQPGGIRTWVNEPYARMFAQPVDALIGTSFFDLIAESDRQRIQAQLAQLTPTAPSRTGVHEVKLPDGRTGWQEWTDRALFDKSGRLIEVQSVGRDITHRIQTERALERSEERYRRIIEDTADWVWERDVEGRHVYSNRQVENVLGYTCDELYGMTIDKIVHPEDLQQIRVTLPELAAQRRGWECWPIRFRHRDGSYRYLESSAHPIFDGDTNLIGYRGIDRDTTFPTLLSRISDTLAGVHASDSDERIERAFRDVGLCYGVERISFWWIDGPYVRRSHEWSREGMEGQQSAIVLKENIPWAEPHLREGRPFKVESLDDLPEDGKERAFLVNQGVRSTLALPLFAGGSLLGMVVFSTVSRARSWPEDVESELRLLAEKIGNIYTQVEDARSMQRRERDLMQSESLARVGSFSYYPYIEGARFPQEWKAEYSKEFCALFEVDHETATRETVLSRIHPKDRQCLRDAIDRLVRKGQDVELQFRVQVPSGRTLVMASTTQIERDSDGRGLRILGAVSDITEQVNREDVLRHALAEIEQLRDRLAEENFKLREEIRSVKGFEEIIGDSDALRKSLDLVSQAAPTNAAILILGETGTGKELVARAIHERSLRAQQPLISLNCSALPTELVESELFGHERGAFTGAHHRREGRFELANGGTLFLDEIGELPLPLQGKLLRVLQDGSFERVGGTETIHVDVRLIAATNRDLATAVENGDFRADLYYRINTVPIELPPLRERREDIPILAQHFVDKYGSRLGKSIEYISPAMLRQLQKKDWPGNVREFEHFIERALISASGNVLKSSEADRHSLSTRETEDADQSSADLRAVEREHILRVLDETGWIVGGERGAAALLNLPPSTLRSKMKKLGIQRRA